MKRAAFAIMISLLCAPPAFAEDVVVLQNGDRLSGEIDKFDGDKVTITTAYADKVAVDWKQVGSITTDEPVWVKLKTGEYVSARFAPRADGIYLEAESLESSRPVHLDEVAAIGLKPGGRWSGNVALMVNGSQGNSETLSLGAQVEGIRESDNDRLRIGGRLDRAENDDEEIAKSTRGWLNYDYYLGKHWYMAGFLTLEYDRFKDLDLRTVVGAGPGYRFIDTKTMLLQADVGLAYVNENFRSGQTDRDYISGQIGEEFRWQITPSQSFFQLVDVYPSLERGEDLLVHAEVGFKHAIAKGGLYVEVALIDDYDNLPAEGRKKNDLKYLVSLGYSL